MQKPSINADTTGLNETRTQLMLVLALFLIGSNLRPMLTSLGPVLESVSHSLQLSSAETGMLITLPVLCFGIFAPFAPRLLRYRSAENLIFWGMILQAVGIALRSLFGVTGLFIGTFIGGASISVVMVLLPSLIKSTFPERASSMMGIYSAALCLGAAIPAGATVPIENLPGSNW
ncbi:MAG TPA: MFS transporter, partial [Burkholderiaceae bacterium]|nr:MFS transporter [Burkholderiaceae bacterium]